MEYYNIYHSIVNDDIIKFNSMKVKHQKRLIETVENVIGKTAKPQEFIEHLKEIIFELVDIDRKNMYYSDFEYLLFLIRAKSYGDNIEYSKKIKKKSVPLTFNISEDISIIGEKGKDFVRVNLSNGDEIELSPLTVEEHFSIDTKQNIVLQKLNILAMSLRKKVFDDEVLSFEMKNSKEDYIDELDIIDLEKLKNAYNTFPKISTKKMEKVGDEEFEIEFGDMESNFFELS